MTATTIRIMEEIAGNKSFEHNWEASVCAQPVRPVQRTGQTGLHGAVWLNVDQPVKPVAKTCQTSRHPETKLHSKTWVTTLKPISYMQLKLMYAMMHAMVQKLLCKALKWNKNK